MPTSHHPPRFRPFAVLAVLAVLLLAGAVQAQSIITVDQVLNAFVPPDVNIQVGDKVRWVWSSGVHDVLEGTDPTIDPTDAFDGPLTMGSPLFAVTFDSKFLFQHPRPGNVYPYVCTPHFFEGMTGTVTVQSQWTNLLSGLAGTNGVPLFWGEGPLTTGSVNTLSLEGAAASSTAVLFIGANQGHVAFKGGTLVPIPYVFQVFMATDPAGRITLPSVWPSGLTGASVVMQFAIVDPGAVKGVALSNALVAVGA